MNTLTIEYLNVDLLQERLQTEKGQNKAFLFGLMVLARRPGSILTVRVPESKRKHKRAGR